jgi:hypothetical protein
MFSRNISEADVRDVVENGEVIEQYPDDAPYPSRLMLGFPQSRALHVVVSEDPQEKAEVIVTVYEPDPHQWKPGFRVRKP